MLREPTPPTQDPPPTNGNGDKKVDDLEKKVEEEEKEIQQIERGLSTTEKVVIASLFLQVLTFAWGVYSFNVRQDQREPV